MVEVLAESELVPTQRFAVLWVGEPPPSTSVRPLGLCKGTQCLLACDCIDVCCVSIAWIWEAKDGSKHAVRADATIPLLPRKQQFAYIGIGRLDRKCLDGVLVV